MRCKPFVLAGAVPSGILLYTGGVAGESAPCSDPAYRAFDFWIGEWRVVTAGGEHAGDNVIAVDQGGCVLVEHWRGAVGSTGTSLSFYSSPAGHWRQVWVSPGVVIDIEGGPDADGMVLAGTIAYQGEDAARPFRGTWTPLPDGRVRQFFEEARRDGSGGVTWQPWFEGYYERSGS